MPFSNIPETVNNKELRTSDLRKRIEDSSYSYWSSITAVVGILLAVPFISIDGSEDILLKGVIIVYSLILIDTIFKIFDLNVELRNMHQRKLDFDLGRLTISNEDLEKEIQEHKQGRIRAETDAIKNLKTSFVLMLFMIFIK